MTQQAPDVSSLFQSAQQDNVISQATLSALQVADIGAQITDALGVPAGQIRQSEVILVNILVDDSGSIRFGRNTEAVRDGHNLIIDALNASKQQNNILIHTRLLNGEIICPYRSIDNAVRLDSHNYNPNKGTPLYDMTQVFLGTVLAKAQEFIDQGVPCRTISLIITDGNDEHSPKCQGGRGTTAGDAKQLIDEMLRQENHIICGMGIKLDSGVDYKQIFRDMGIRDEWIKTPASSQSEIRAACQVFSQSAVRASQSAASFSQQAIGGFGN